MPEPLIVDRLSQSGSIPDELRTELPLKLQDAIDILPESQQRVISALFLEAGQYHLFEDFTSAISPPVRRQFAQQLEELDKSYADGGLVGYIKNARKLLDNSRRGINPLAGWIPTVPVGETFRIGSDPWKAAEQKGLQELGSCGFVLVAGGLGERLGYNGIKIGLPTESSTGTCYLEHYIEYILAVQSKLAPAGRKLPLCIMTSKDTNERTLALLTKNDYFGMDPSQITLVQQGLGVPAIMDTEARLALGTGGSSIHYSLITKPHGHGDIHELMYSHGIAKKWLKSGINWLTIFQDTNGLAFHSLPLMLGVSVKSDLIMNSLCVPRKAKQAIGGIVRLVKESTKEIRTLNVEYNQLDPLLRASGYEDGDVNDTKTGYSLFPGNINQLVFKLEPYVTVLERTRGLMPEFVNPKYKDETKTEFKSPTRLECMMQDFPVVLEGEEVKRVGFTTVPAEICFSPVKNSNEDGVKLQAQGIAAATAATGEADQYSAQRELLRRIGVVIENARQQTYNGITIVPGPAIVLKPDFVLCPSDYFDKFPFPAQVKISPRSTLIVRGSGVVIESLELDGTYIIDHKDGRNVVIRDKVIKNLGWRRIRDEGSDNQFIRMRGFRIEKLESETDSSEASKCVVM